MNDRGFLLASAGLGQHFWQACGVPAITNHVQH